MAKPKSEEQSFLMGGDRVISASFENEGDSCEGFILDKVLRQQTKFQTDKKAKAELEFWDDGRPKMQLVVTLQTEERDGEIEGDDDFEDDGRRKLYLRYKLKNAVSKAVRDAGADDLEIGGYLRVALTVESKKIRGGGFTAKDYEAEYTVPTSESASFLSGDDDGEPADEPAAPPAKKAAAKKAPPKPPAPAAEPVDEWVEDDTHTTGEDGTRWVWDAEAEDWTEWVAPRKAPAKKAAPRKAVAADPGF